MRNISDIKDRFMPVNALIVYKNIGSSYEQQLSQYFIMKHTILDNGTLGAGKPLTKDFIYKILNGGNRQKPQYMQERIVMHSDNITVWWKPEKAEYLSFLPESGIASGMYPLPPMLFALQKQGRGYTLYNFALCQNERPKPETVVYHSPLYNVHNNGQCCMGNVSLPETGEIDTWEKVFFGSTCAPDLKPTLNEDPVAMWNSILNKESFPTSRLVRYGLLEDIW